MPHGTSGPKRHEPVERASDLRVGARYRVEGILHVYVGPALLPASHRPVCVFERAEWRPNTADQLLFTLIDEVGVPNSVTGKAPILPSPDLT